jgi:membrane fusion protein, multidrug efflux system
MADNGAAAGFFQTRRGRWLLSALAAFAAVGLLLFGYWYLYARNYQSTDDAYVAGDLVNVVSQVSGTVVSIGADETDRVQVGQELVRLDSTDAQIALRDSEARLARMVRQVRTVFANRDQLEAVVAQRKADLSKAQSDLDRRKDLAASGAVSAEELSHVRDTLSAARDGLVAAEKNLAASAALTGQTGVADNPDVRAAAADVERSYLALRRTSIRAPVSGYVAKRAVQLGERVAPGGQPLLSIVPLDRLRIEANFKEVQLRQMRIGQPARIVADLYGGHVEFHGKVAGLGLGTGAAFALLPAQNATGNWIKVVQRVPARIELDQQELAAHPLRIGLSTKVEVDVRDASGPILARVTRRAPVLATHAYDIDRQEILARIAHIIDENTAEGAGQWAAQQR